MDDPRDKIKIDPDNIWYLQKGVFDFHLDRANKWLHLKLSWFLNLFKAKTLSGVGSLRPKHPDELTNTNVDDEGKLKVSDVIPKNVVIDFLQKERELNAYDADGWNRNTLIDNVIKQILEHENE